MNFGAILTKIVGGSASTLVDSIGNAIDKNVTNKEERERLKLEMEIAANEHTENMIASQNKELELYLKDTQDARNREIQIATSDKAPLINKIISPLLAILILGSCFLFWYMMLYTHIEKEKEILIAEITGALTTLAVGVVSYYFGSSQGSAAKQKQLDSMMNK